MPVFPSNREEILSRYIENLTSKTSINMVIAGSKARTIGETVAREIELLSQLEEANFEKSFFSTSYGQFLARHVGAFGIRKRPARNAEVLSTDRAIKFYVENNETFGSINNNASFIIPSGTILTAPSDLALETESSIVAFGETNSEGDREIHYVTTSDALCEPSAKEAFVAAKAMVRGASGNLASTNMLIYHGFTEYQDYYRKKLRVTNTKPILSGVNEEDESSLKYRGSKAVTSAEGSNETALAENVLKIPGIVDYVMLPFEDGVGRFNIYIKSITSTVSDRMLEEAQQVLDEFRAVGVIGIAKKPLEIGIEIKSTLLYDKNYKEEEKALMRENISYAAMTYINSLDIGQPLLLAQLAERLRAIDNRISGVGSNPVTKFDHFYIYYPSRFSTNGKRREKLIAGSVNTLPNTRIIVEPTISNPIQLV